jgi:uncharacterized protein YcfL
MTQLLLRTGIITVVLCILSACSSNKAYVEYENSAMSHKLEVGEIRTRTLDDMVQLGIDLTNRTSSELRFQYKFKFFDKDGFEAAPDSRPWTRKILSAKETANIQVIAPNNTVVGGKIYIKE